MALTRKSRYAMGRKIPREPSAEAMAIIEEEIERIYRALRAADEGVEEAAGTADTLEGTAITELTGDVTAEGPGAAAATIGDNAVTYAKMQNVSATARILGRKTAAAGDPEECTLSEVLDFIGSAARGDILYRGAASWARLAAGVSGRFLKTNGAGADPSWAAAGSGTVTFSGVGSNDNRIARFDGVTGTVIQNSAAAIEDSGALTGVFFPQNDLELRDTGNDHALRLTAAENLTADRILSLVVGNAARTLTLSGNPTLADWFDQAVKAASSPSFNVLTLTGGQLVFPAAQNASAGANTLDDYEEGSWTPVLGGTGGESGQAYTNQIGRYVKIGKLVVCTFRISLSTLGTITGSAVVKGLPFTIENVASGRATMVIGQFSAMTTPVIAFFGEGDNNTSEVFVSFTTAAATGTTQAAQADFSNTTNLVGKVYYRTDN